MPSSIFKIGSLAALCLLVTGCYNLLVSTSRQPISARSTNDFEFVRLTHPGESEVERRLGKPGEYFPDLHVAVYPIDTVIRHRLMLFLFILPVHYYRDYDRYDIACIEFDGQDDARRCDVILQRSDYLRFEAERWLKNRDKSN